MSESSFVRIASCVCEMLTELYTLPSAYTDCDNMMRCCVQPTDEMLELASDKRDEAMAAVADGWFHSYCCRTGIMF